MEEHKMKKINLAIIILLLMSTFVFADEWISFEGKGEASPEYDILQSNSSYVEFELEIPGMESKDVESYNRLYIPEHTKMDSVGYPEVPFVSYLIAIPECNSVDLNVTVLDSVVIDSMNVYPAPEWVNMEEVFTLNAAAYGTDAYFPGYTGELTGKGAVRAQHCIRVNIYPVQFNPVQQEVIAYSRVNIEMSFNGVSGSINEDVGIFNAVCGVSMINYDSNGLNASVSCGAGYDDPGSVKWLTDLDSLCMGEQGIHCDYLIITHDSFWVNPYIDSLAQKRANYNGFDVVIVKMGDIIGQIYSQYPDDHAEKMRNLIKDIFDNGRADHTYDDRIGYVNLFGDCYFGEGLTTADICVPSYPMPNPYATPDPCKGYDNYFARLTGIGDDYDVYPDVLIGRCPVDDEEQVANVCRKIINYEPIPSTTPWLNNMTFVNTCSSSEANGEFEIILPMVEDYYCKLFSYERYYDDTWDPPEELQQYFYRGWDATMPRTLIEDEYEDGSFMISYMGHGAIWKLLPQTPCQYFTYQAIDDDDYNGRLPFISSMSCETGAFQNNDECMAEKFLVYNDKRGAIGFVAASQSIGNFSFAKYLFEASHKYSLGMEGEMLLEGKLKTSSDFLRQTFNLFGDPALNILLDSENVNYCDFIFNSNHYNINETENRTIQIEMGICNRSFIDYIWPISIRCFLLNTLHGNEHEEVITINDLDGMEEKIINFEFDVSYALPSEFIVNIEIDPDNLIVERDEDNNNYEGTYGYYRYQEGFPYISHEHNLHIYELPLFHNNSIILGGRKVDSSGNLEWTCPYHATYLTLPVYNNTLNEYNYIILGESPRHLYKINDSGEELVHFNTGIVTAYCLGDINNDGEAELIYGTKHGFGDYKLEISDLEGNSLIDPIDSNPVNDLAIGDSDNDGKNELYGLLQNSLISYVFDNGELTEINQYHISEYVQKLILDDFNSNGILDIAVLANEHIYLLESADFNELDIVDLSDLMRNAAAGDIDNDGITEFLLLQEGNGSSTLDVYIVDYNDNSYEYKFSFNNISLWENNIILYDFNSDNNLEVLFNITEDNLDYFNILEAYNLDGELLLSFPKTKGKTKSIIADIDNDNDIEIIFGEDCSDFYSSTDFSVSDLDIPVGAHGNIYPNMNEWNNNLYSQPVTGTLNEETTYYWDGTITLHEDVILPESSVLNILPGTVIKAREDSRLIIYGDIAAEGTEDNPIIFEPAIYDAPSSYWSGIVLSGGMQASIKHCHIMNADTCIYAIGNVTALIDSCLISHCDVGISILTSGAYEISNNEINNYTQNSIEIIGVLNISRTYPDSIDIYNNVISGNSGVSDNGIYVFNKSGKLEIYDNDITVNDNGISVEDCGSIHVYRNDIRGNTVGMYILDSYPGLKENTIVGNNGVGIFISGDSYPVIELDNLVMNNGNYEMYIIWGDPLMQNGHNDIVNENKCYLLYKHEEMPPGGPLQVEYNWWGDYPPNEELFSPLEYFDFTPADEEPNCRGKDETPPSPSMFAFDCACQLQAENKFEQAESSFKNIISMYPELKVAYASLRRILSCEKYLQYPDFGELASYYDTLSTSPDTLFSTLSRNLSAKCEVEQEQYAVALNEYDSVLLSNPMLTDSVFTVINIMRTLMLADTYGEKSNLKVPPRILEMKPSNMAEYTAKKKELLQKIGYPLLDEPEIPEEVPEIFCLHHNYPNPLTHSTTISFSLLPNTKKADLKIYNIRGQLVRKLDVESTPGNGDITWDGLDTYGRKVCSGIYFYKLTADKKETIKKMVLIR